MKTFTGLLFLILITIACQNVKETDEYKQVVAEKAALTEEMNRMEQELNAITFSMNQIENNLVAMRRNEMKIELIKEDANAKQNERIFLILAEMGDHLEENKTIIAKLEKQVAQSKVANASLKQLVALQKKAILEKEVKIQELNKSLDQLKEEFRTTVAIKDSIIQRQEHRISTQQRNIVEKENTLQTAYIVYGGREELTQKGVLQADGGVAGIGRNYKLSNKFDPSTFNVININQVHQVQLGVTNKQKALTSHPGDSYYFVKTEGQTYLKIIDPAKFWSISKYLVIVIEN